MKDISRFIDEFYKLAEKRGMVFIEPRPLPCIILGRLGLLSYYEEKHGRPICEKTDCPFKKLKTRSRTPRKCAIRPQRYNELVKKASNNIFSFDRDLNAKELIKLLRYIQKYKPQSQIEKQKKRELVTYLKILKPVIELCPILELNRTIYFFYKTF